MLTVSSINQVFGINGSGAQDKRTGIGGFCIFYEDRTECRFHDGDGISTVIVDDVLQDIGDRSVCHPVTDRIVIEQLPDESELVTIVVSDCSGDETSFNAEYIPTQQFGYLKIAG